MARLADRRAASLTQLQQIKDVTPEIAAAVRNAWKTVRSREEARKQVDRLIETHGVEYLGIHRRTGDHVYYCNAGDTYATTVMFRGLCLTVGCIGDLLEPDLIREPQP
jgi:hypothetical protein